MTKREKLVAEKAGIDTKYLKKYNFKANQSYDIGQLKDLEHYSGMVLTTDKHGRIISIDTRAQFDSRRELEQVEKEANKIVIEEKAKSLSGKILGKGKTKPEDLYNKVAKAYDEYDEAVIKLESDPKFTFEGDLHTASLRAKHRKKTIKMKNLVKHGLKYSKSENNADEIKKIVGYIKNKPPEEVGSEDLGGYDTRKDPTRARDVLKSLDQPGATEKVLKQPTSVSDMTDEELLKRLQRK